jgi:hypothetical protein
VSILVVLAATTGSHSLATAEVPASHEGAGDETAATDAAVATEAVLTTAAVAVSPGNPVRTTVRLTVPAGATWSADPDGGALVVTVAAGTLRIGVVDGFARVAHPPDPTPGARSVRELAEGGSLVLRPGDRLVMHGHGSVVASNIGRATALAAVIHVR